MYLYEEKAETLREKIDDIRNCDEFEATKKVIKETEIAMLWNFLTMFTEHTTPYWKNQIETMLEVHVRFYEKEYGEIKDIGSRHED